MSESFRLRVCYNRNMILRLENLSKHFGSFKAVDTLNVSVARGEVVGFVGPNGAGKTTTINMILGFTRPTTGSVTVLKQTVSTEGAHRQHREMGYASGDMELPARLTGRQYLQLIAGIRGDTFEKRLIELSKRFAPQLDKQIHTLSRGNKQKIALIGAFIASPKLVVLDEPTSGLDPIMQERFMELIREEQQRGTTIFMSSHYLGEIAELCSRILLMQHGKIIEDVAANELLSRGGRMVTVVTSHKRTVAPKGAEHVIKETVDGMLRLQFAWKHEAPPLQVWLAGVKGLVDLEISEYSLESAFQKMYKDETGDAG